MQSKRLPVRKKTLLQIVVSVLAALVGGIFGAYLLSLLTFTLYWYYAKHIPSFTLETPHIFFFSKPIGFMLGLVTGYYFPIQRSHPRGAGLSLILLGWLSYLPIIALLAKLTLLALADYGVAGMLGPTFVTFPYTWGAFLWSTLLIMWGAKLLQAKPSS